MKRRGSSKDPAGVIDISESLAIGVEHVDHEAEPLLSSASSEDNDDLRASEDDDEQFIAAQQSASNRKTSNKPKVNRKTGGFQSMGINAVLLKAITRKGFSVPTPIQRKAMPLILDGQDVVGMARTGSGKTAAFVIPMIEKLKAHKVQVGTRALLLAPSRELALQTVKVVKELSRGTDLRTSLVVGGDSLEDQFKQMSNNPDILIATPGRFLHLMVEMSLDLSSISYMVFDEADRLFEMGFQSQLLEILHALPPSRQTLLFSATLPSSLVEFARAGLKEPRLVRLDAESKVSPDLRSVFLTLKEGDKDGALLFLLESVLKIPQKQEHKETLPTDSKKRKRENTKVGNIDPPTQHSTILFASSQKEVEYLWSLLSYNYNVSFVHGGLDQTARKAHIEKFRNGLSSILVVTDVAARGIDLPMLGNVINFAFPPHPKIYVHRVGRTARAGRKGSAFSLVETADLPYLLDLHLFLDRKVEVGGFPRASIEPSCEYVSHLLESDTDLSMQRMVASRAKQQYIRSRSSASIESAHRAKTLARAKELQEPHAIFECGGQTTIDGQRDELLSRIRGFRPTETVFEVGKRGEENEATEALRRQRTRISNNKQRLKQTDASQSGEDQGNQPLDHPITTPETPASIPALAHGNQDRNAGVEVDHDTHRNSDQSDSPDPDAFSTWADGDNFMSYRPRETNQVEDKGYSVHSGSGHTSFVDAARGVTMDLDNDESSRSSSRMRWDKRGKKYVSQANDEDGSKGKRMIKGESGQKLAATFRSGKFEAWKKANRIGRLARPGEKEGPSAAPSMPSNGRRFKHFAERTPKQPDKYRDDYHKQKKKLAERATNSGANHTRPAKSELRSVEDVRKQRLLKQKRREKNARPSKRQRR